MISPTSALLPEEPVLLVQGRLARALGLTAALFLQQVHYWLLRSRHQHGGQPWIYNTYSQWQVQFPFLSRDQLARAVARLRRLGVLQVAHWDADRRERRNWYSIDYARLAAVLGTDEEPAPVIGDLANSAAIVVTTALPDADCVPTCGATLAAIAASPLPDLIDNAEVMSARPCPADRPPIMQICRMDDSPVAAHPEITPSEITQRSSQEDAAPACSSSPPCRSRSAERGTRNGLTESGPGAVCLCPAPLPSAPDSAEPPAENGSLSATHIMSTMFALPLAAPAVADHRASRSLPPPPPTSAFRIPTSAFVWGVYRAALDPAAPPGLRTRIAADLAGAAARGVPLTPRGLAYALNESATARGPRWPYLFAVWQAHPDGPAERGTRIAELPNAERGSPQGSPCGSRNAEYGWRPDPSYRRSPRSATRNPPSLDPSKYAPGGKYGHLFACQTAVAT